MSIEKLKRTVARLASQLGVDVRDESDLIAENQAEARDEYSEAFLILREAVPAKLHARLDAAVLPSDTAWRPFKLAVDSLARLVDDVRRGWFVSAIPAAVVTSLLDYPLYPWLVCSRCELRLPMAGGTWRHAKSESFWQGDLTPFVDCPACGGAIVRRDGRPYNRAKYLPPLAEPGPWRFEPNEWECGAGVAPIGGGALVKLFDTCRTVAA